MKKTGLLLIVCLITILSFADTASAQSSWGGAMNVGVNQHFSGNVGFHGSVDVTVANGFTLSVGGSVTGNGYTLYKRGGGRFWFMADNMNFGSDIVYLGKSDTVRLDGVFGTLVNNSVGYVHTGKIFSSSDSISFFHLHQHDTVVQTFNAHGYNRTNTNLYLYSDTRSKLRITHSSDSLAGTVHLSAGGTLYIDGTYDAKILVADTGLLITGENSIAIPVHPDYATFASHTAGNDTAIAVSTSILQVGGGLQPSLVNVSAGHIVLRDSSTLKIDVFSPKKSWNLTQGIHSGWNNAFSDKIYLDGGNCYFAPKSRIDVNWDTAYLSTVKCDTVFYLPVIMLGSGSIVGANNVTVNQNLPSCTLSFVIGDGGANGTVAGWGYVKCKNESSNIIPTDIRVFVNPATAGTVHLSSYIDSLTHDYTIKWLPASAFIHDGKGSLDVSGWSIPQTMVYRYTVGKASCNAHTAKAYVHAVGKYGQTKTIYICKDLPNSNTINLNRIFGMEAGSGAVWTTLNDSQLATSSNIEVFISGRHAGGRVFDAVQAYADAGAHTDYDYGAGMKKFEIQYTHGAITKTVMLIVY